MKNLRLKAARAALDMSQQDLADKVGVSRQTINAIEKATTTPRSSSASPSAASSARPWTSCSGKSKQRKPIEMNIVNFYRYDPFVPGR